MKIKKLHPDAILPTQGSAEAAGYDLYSVDAVCIEPGEIRPIHTGIAIDLLPGFWPGIYARSGLAAKKGLRPANCVGKL